MGNDTKRFNKLYRKTARKQIGEEWMVIQDKFKKTIRRLRIWAAVTWLIVMVETTGILAYLYHAENERVKAAVETVLRLFK